MITLAEMQQAVEDFRLGLTQLHKEMQDAEAMAEFLNIPVPWKVQEYVPSRKRRSPYSLEAVERWDIDV